MVMQPVDSRLVNGASCFITSWTKNFLEEGFRVRETLHSLFW